MCPVYYIPDFLSCLRCQTRNVLWVLYQTPTRSVRDALPQPSATLHSPIASSGDCNSTLTFSVEAGHSFEVTLALHNQQLNQYSFCMNCGSREFPHDLDLHVLLCLVFCVFKLSRQINMLHCSNNTMQYTLLSRPTHLCLQHNLTLKIIPQWYLRIKKQNLRNCYLNSSD